MVMSDVALLIIEAAVAILGLAIAVGKKKLYGWFIAITFAIYVADDLIHLFALPVGEGVINITFMAAGLSMLYAAWGIYKE